MCLRGQSLFSGDLLADAGVFPSSYLLALSPVSFGHVLASAGHWLTIAFQRAKCSLFSAPSSVLSSCFHDTPVSVIRDHLIRYGQVDNADFPKHSLNFGGSTLVEGRNEKNECKKD